MKRTIIFCVMALALMSSVLLAQNAPINFETGGHGANWTWTVFENATNPAVEILPNPHSTGINTSATVAKFTALVGGQPWAGCESQHGADIGTFTFTNQNCTVKIMVYKTVISDVGIKFASASGASTGEIKVANTLINQWEEITFDFSSRIGETNDQFILFPDFNLAGRTTDNVIYWDNISFSPQTAVVGPDAPAPTPTAPAANVISLFSNAYTNVPVDTWSAVWDVADLADIQIDGNDTKLYTNLVYAGIEFTSQPINASDMLYFHMDVWTPNSTALPAVFKIKLVDFGADGAYAGGDDSEHELSFDTTTTPALVSSAWIGFDIPLTAFAGLASRAHLAQMIIAGTLGTVYVDNVYFRSNTTAADDHNAVPVPARLGTNHPNPFKPTTTISYTLDKSAHVALQVFDVKGRLVETLVDAVKTADTHYQAWNASAAAPGVYLYRLTVNNTVVDTKRMLLLK